MTEVLIDGSWGPSQSGALQVVENPATLKPVAAAPFCDAQDVVLAMAAARRAVDRWVSLPVSERVALLADVGRELEVQAADIAGLQSLESGQPYRQCLEATAAAAQCFTRLALPGLSTAPNLTQTGARPGGAHAMLLDPDFPLLHWACSAVPLLVGGSTLVCAAPRSAPLAVLRAAHCAGALPPGVLNLLVASPEAVRAAVGGVLPGGHPGSEGIEVHSGATDVVFVSDGAAWDATLEGSASLRLFHTGQRAGQGARIYVDERIAAEFADRLHEYLAFLECGDPRNSATDLGALRSSATLARVEEQVGRALKRGALLKVGGRRYQPWGLRGFFFQPTLMIEGRGGERAPDAQIHGPVVIVSPVRNLAGVLSQERIRRLNYFGPDLETQLQSLKSAGIDFEVTPVTTPLERIMEGFGGIGEGRLRIESGAGDARLPVRP